MFRKSSNNKQINAFSSVEDQLKGLAGSSYNDSNNWHNVFNHQVVERVDESLFSILYNKSMGCPNSPVRILIGMILLKEAFGWSDSQLFEQCRFNLLVRKALGLINLDDEVPVESTYYLFRNRIYNYEKENGENLMERAFNQITQGQANDFQVNGRNIRMDSKLIGSNIAINSRYELIHKTFSSFLRSLEKEQIHRLPQSTDLEAVCIEDSSKTVYHSTSDELKTKLLPIGKLIHQMLFAFASTDTDAYRMLKQLFNEQYKVAENEDIVLRDKEEIPAAGIQSPFDTECTHRNKNNKPVKGYSVNITETCSDNQLNLVTNIIVDTASRSDSSFLQDAIEKTSQIIGQDIETCNADGAYNSPENTEYAKKNNIDFICSGIQGATPRYELSNIRTDGTVIDNKTGEIYQIEDYKPYKNKNSSKFRIKTEHGYRYFREHEIQTALARQKLVRRTNEELYRRNNVEATIFHLSHRLSNNKTKYRGLFKHKLWALLRGLWINVVRIMRFKQNHGKNIPCIIQMNNMLINFSTKTFTYWLFCFKKRISLCL
ncbi:MAG: transposase [Bacteroidales bacterium]|nr:transposase [Bacteroidales bacterium]